MIERARVQSIGDRTHKGLISAHGFHVDAV